MSRQWLRAACAEATGTDGHPTQEKTQWKHFEGGLVSDKRRPEARRSWFLCNRTLWPQHNGRGLTDEEHCCWVESPEWRCPHHSGTTASRKFHNSNAKKRKQLWTNAWINHQVIFNAKKNTSLAIVVMSYELYWYLSSRSDRVRLEGRSATRPNTILSSCTSAPLDSQWLPMD